MLDRRFFNANLIVQSIANSPADNPIAGTQYIVGEEPDREFSTAKAGQIACYDGKTWNFIPPKSGELEVINLSTHEILSYDGTAWRPVLKLRTSKTVTEYHILNSKEVDKREITLENYIADEDLPCVVVSVCGIIQMPGIDYDVYENIVTWKNKSLDSIGLIIGDTITVQYERR